MNQKQRFRAEALGTENGGPAFPLIVEGERRRAEIVEAGFGGMTLRDYFAAKALQSIILADGVQYLNNHEDHACDAYKQADAMLKARAND